jgi:hypothetical protein
MRLFEKKVTKNIGAETDDILLEKLKKTLDNHNAILIKEDNIVVGSQEIQLYDYKIGKDKISVTVETYVGISLSGKESIINKIATAVADT